MDSFFTSVDFVSKWGAALFGLSVASFLRPLKWLLKVSKSQNKIVEPKLLPKNEPTNWFFNPDYSSE